MIHAVPFMLSFFGFNRSMTVAVLILGQLFPLEFTSLWSTCGIHLCFRMFRDKTVSVLVF